jgi:hypothetical protein
MAPALNYHLLSNVETTMFAFDPHLNQSVAIRNLTVNGVTHTYFNPFNFTTQPFFLNLAPFSPGLSEFKPGDQIYAFQYAVNCVIPVSGVYCLLNRSLLFAEIFFGLVALSLSYEWLSVISIAAAMNYTAVAAIHAIILFVSGSQHLLYFPYDTVMLFEILGASVLLAHPLQQWSQTLQKRVFARTSFVLACWCVLVCTAFILIDRSDPHLELPTTEIDGSTQIPLGLGLSLNDLLCNDCFNDTINRLPLLTTPEAWKNLHGRVIPCPNPDPAFLSPWYRDSSLVPALFQLDSLELNKSFLELDYVFSIYSIIASAATVALAFHGQHSTHFVRAKIYLWFRGERTSRWRPKVGLVVALLYHAIQFILGIASLPIAIVSIVLNEYTNTGLPLSEQPSDLGQWGPCVGALLLVLVVILNTGSTAYILRRSLSWILFTPAHLVFPTKVRRRRLPTLDIDWSQLYRVQGGPRWLALFFIDEYLSTREWLRSPFGASLNCIAEEEAFASESKSETKILLPKSGSRV